MNSSIAADRSCKAVASGAVGSLSRTLGLRSAVYERGLYTDGCPEFILQFPSY